MSETKKKQLMESENRTCKQISQNSLALAWHFVSTCLSDLHSDTLQYPVWNESSWLLPEMWFCISHTSHISTHSFEVQYGVWWPQACSMRSQRCWVLELHCCCCLERPRILAQCTLPSCNVKQQLYHRRLNLQLWQKGRKNRLFCI